jgi:hypothetical protein
VGLLAWELFSVDSGSIFGKPGNPLNPPAAIMSNAPGGEVSAKTKIRRFGLRRYDGNCLPQRERRRPEKLQIVSFAGLIHQIRKAIPVPNLPAKPKTVDFGCPD